MDDPFQKLCNVFSALDEKQMVQALQFYSIKSSEQAATVETFVVKTAIDQNIVRFRWICGIKIRPHFEI